MTRRRLHAEAGVSLVETLVALAIVALMAGAVFVIADLGRDPARAPAERLVRSLAAAREAALVTGEPVGFSADPDGRGWRFFVYRGELWRPANAPGFEPARIAEEGLALRLAEGGVARRASREDSPPPAPEVWFDPAGFDAPFAYVLGAPGGASLLILRGGAGGLRLEAPQDEPA